MHGRITITVLILLAGCTQTSPAPIERETGETPQGQAFELGPTGTIQGRVVWNGDVPSAEKHVVRVLAYNPFLHQKPAQFTTPHAPAVHRDNGGIANAVVYLRGIDPRRSRPWDHAKARVAFDKRQLLIEQGDSRSEVGFVQKGHAIEIVNRDSEYHLLRARGSAFFATPLNDVKKVHERSLPQSGMIDLTCAAGYYWLHAHLFVAEHPYYARTDKDGRFVLDRVPAGAYEIVCWLPNWRVERTERDPETADIVRWFWAAPREQTQNICVVAGRPGEITYSWNQKIFNEDQAIVNRR